MRKPACTNDYRWYQETLHPGDLSSTTTTLTDTDGSQTVEWPWGSTSYYPPGPTTVVQTAPASDYQCCGQCEIYGPNVEVYYWPEPNADDSCLSIIGDKVNPPLEGAKTDNAGDVWWGTVTKSVTSYPRWTLWLTELENDADLDFPSVHWISMLAPIPPPAL